MANGKKTPGEFVVELFDGERELAKQLNCDPTTVWRFQPWPKSNPRFNLNGIIPPRWYVPLLKLAEKQGKKLTTDDLIRGRKA